MLAVDIPGYGALRIEHLVLDYNGTVAVDGMLLPGVKRRLRKLADDVRVHVVTADTFGKASSELRGLRSEIKIIGRQSQDRAKAAYVQRIGPQITACIGNGRNDRLMLRAAALGIAVVQAEGAASAALLAADVVVNDVRHALDLLVNPLRLTAVLRT